MVPNEGRLAAHVLLDAVVAGGEFTEEEIAYDAIQLAIDAMPATNAVKVAVDDDGDTLDVAVDYSHLLMPAVVSMQWLVGRLAIREGRSTAEVVVDLREFWDGDTLDGLHPT